MLKSEENHFYFERNFHFAAIVMAGDSEEATGGAAEPETADANDKITLADYFLLVGLDAGAKKALQEVHGRE